MKVLALAMAIAAIFQISEGVAQKPFFPSASAPSSDEVGTAGSAFKQTSFNANDNPNSRPQISPPFQGQKPQISPTFQGQQSQTQGQTRPQVQPVQGQRGPHVVQPIVQDKPQISPVYPSATDSHKVEPRQLTTYQQGETSYGSPSNAYTVDSSQLNSLYQPAGYNWGYSGSTGGYQNNQQQKPGSCYRGSAFPYQSNNGGYNYNYNTNQNAGYYHTRRSVDAVSADSDAKELVKREAPLASQSGGYQTYQSPGGYGYSSGNNGYSGGGYSSGGYSGYQGGGYSGGGYNGGGGFHGGNGIIPSSTYRPGFGSGSGYCYRDYDCAGIKKCCSGVCTNPAAVIG